TGRRRCCSAAGRHAAWRARHPLAPGLPRAPPGARPTTVSAGPAGEPRSRGEHGGPEGHLVCRRVGPGGAGPPCDEPVALVARCSDTGPTPGRSLAGSIVTTRATAPI